MVLVARILLLRRLPRGVGVFAYGIPDALASDVQIGSVVAVPFRRKRTVGVILALRRSSPLPRAKLKLVLEVIRSSPIATPKQFSLIRSIASYFHASPATVARTFIPVPTTLRSKKRAQQNGRELPQEPPRQSERVRELLTIAFRQRSKTLLLYHAERNVFWCYHILAERAVRAGKTLVIVFPRIVQCGALFASLPASVQKKTVVLTSDQSAGKRFAEYQKILEGARVVIGTQAALLPPLSSLSVLVLHDEESSLYARAEQNPRMHLRKVAVQVANKLNASLILASRAPSIATFFAKGFGHYRPVHVLPTRPRAIPLSPVDLREERRGGNAGIFSEALFVALDRTMQDGNQGLLVTFRKGIASILTCADCGLQPRCSRCSLPLRYYTAQMVCPQGHERRPVPLRCPSCNGTRLRPAGVGSQRVEAELRLRYPQKNIVRFDTDNPDANERALEHADLIVATSVPWITATLPRLRLAALVLLDALLGRPDLSADEEAFRMLVTLSETAKEAGAETLLCQTYQPQHPVIRAVADNAFGPWYERMLRERRRFHYPPFGHILRLSVQRPTRAAAAAAALGVFRLLRSARVPGMDLLPPSMSLDATSHRWVRYQIIVKTPLDPKHHRVGKLVDVVPKDWLIDVDPDSLA